MWELSVENKKYPVADLSEFRKEHEALSKITVQEASELMRVTPRFLQLALQQNKFPFGIGVKMGKWAYYINARRFYEYMKITRGDEPCVR